jgi:ribose transport system ATP-binding protein
MIADPPMTPPVGPPDVLGAAPLVRMTGIIKQYGTAVVLADAAFELRPGEVHVLAGENGAGKSTLMKILAGVVTDFDGVLEIGGREVRPSSPLEAARMGVAVIHQELSLVGAMSVADNMFLARHPSRVGLVNDRQQRAEAARHLERLGLDLDVKRPVEQFPIAVQQLIEIAKALSLDARVVVMDEPTSALNAPEVEKLFALIADLKRQGRGIVYISHKMEEIELLADRITVLRDGRNVGTAAAVDLPPAKLVQWMVGREMAARSERIAPPRRDPPRLAVTNFSAWPASRTAKPAVADVSMFVQPGEVVGLGGLQGSGASELLLGLFGAYGRRTAGAVSLDGQPLSIATPRQAIDAGIALLTNDRKETGLVLGLPITANISLADLPHLSPGGWRRSARERRIAEEAAASLRIRAHSLSMPVGELSGGNQQKVAIAKWVQTRPKVLLLDEPTRGIDVAAKREIYDLISRWTADGTAVVVITSEMSELLELSDRIYVMHRGYISAELSRSEATAEAVLVAAMGGEAMVRAAGAMGVRAG